MRFLDDVAARLLGRRPATVPRVGALRLGDLRRLTPISRRWGADRGLPIDRYYIERFLFGRQDDIRGHVLEVQDPRYAKKIGGDRVAAIDVLDVSEENRQATVVADLSQADPVGSDRYDCLILTQTLHMIYPIHAAVSHAFRITKPGGVVLATFPGISKTCADPSGDYWRLTEQSARKLFEEYFPAANVDVEGYGNVLSAAAFLYGLAAQELAQAELAHRDPLFDVIIGVRAVKP